MLSTTSETFELPAAPQLGKALNIANLCNPNDLQPTGLRKVPFEQAIHRRRVDGASEDALVPRSGRLQILDDD